MSRNPGLARFGPFEADFRAGELRRDGERIKLQQKPFEVLIALVQARGELVTRRELHQRLWPDDTFVVFDDNLNTAVKKLREALGDSAKQPRFIETLPRRGYRLVAPVELESKSWIRSLAVLPFENLSGVEEYRVDGMTEALIHDLGRIAALRVTSRTSSMAFKNVKKSLPDIADELGVDALVEGSLLWAEDSIRVTARLIDAAADQALWTGEYEREPSRILDLSAQLALAIVGEIKVRSTPEERRSLTANRTVNPDAHDAYLKGLYSWNRWTPDGWRQGLAHLRRATRIDPLYARAHARVGTAYNLLGSFGVLAPEVAHPAARSAALEAIRIDESIAVAHAVLGLTLAAYDWEWDEAEAELSRALELNPGSTDTRYAYGILLARRGAYRRGIEQMNRVLTHDPLSLRCRAGLGLVHYLARDHARAVRTCTEILDLEPAHPYALWILGMTLDHAGSTEEAVVRLEQAVAASPGNHHTMASLGRAYAGAGRREDARRLLDGMTRLARGQYVSPSAMAKIHAGLGDRDRLFACLEQAYRTRDSGLAQLADPVWDPVRSEPRFQDLLARVNLA